MIVGEADVDVGPADHRFTVVEAVRARGGTRLVEQSETWRCERRSASDGCRVGRGAFDRNAAAHATPAPRAKEVDPRAEKRAASGAGVGTFDRGDSRSAMSAEG
jgi:hypothetical protein